jgi:hypothetical protein
MKRLVLLAAVVAVCACAQVTSSLLTGLVTDSTGGAVPNAVVTVLNSVTGQIFTTTTNSQGDYAVPSIPAAIYRVTVSAQGFKTTTVNLVKIDASVPATVNLKLEVGTVNETIEVSAGAEVLQSSSATVSSTLVGRQLVDLPFATRNLLEVVVTQPGTQTPGTPRTSSINGLPKGSVNITVDGMNIQDNLLKSSDGFFANIQPKTDSIEEVTVSTAGVGADSSGEGAAQVKFVTRSGGNEFHGGLFWQNRNTAFDANYYFNNINGLERDRINLNQEGGSLGGPFKKNKAFFFVSFDEFDLPQTYNVSANVPTAEAVNGIFTYQDSATRQIRQVNLYQLAAGKNPTLPAGTRAYPTTPDPAVAASLAQYLKLATPQTGSLVDRITSLNDYNRNVFNFQAPGTNVRRFLTTKFDYNLTSKHHFDSVWNYQYYNSNPDGVNSIFPVLPGTGTVLGHPESGGIRRYAFSIEGALRSTLSSHLTNEARFGNSGGGTGLFREQIAPALFSQWNGYGTSYNNYLQNPYRSTTASRRNTPLWQATDNATFVKGSHLVSFGGSFTQVNSWQSTSGTAVVPTVTFGTATNDPVNTGAISLFDTTNFPNSTPTNRSDAAALYAILTGRVQSITRSLGLDEKTLQYGHVPTVDRNRQREMAYYGQDSWRVRSNFTLNYGVRWDVQFPFVNLNGAYTRVGEEGVWGVSGIGHLFQPGVLTGTAPQFVAVKPGQQSYETKWKQFAPFLGFAWMIPHTGAPVLSHLLGSNGQSVLRAGYSIATVREGMNVPISIWGGNQGVTQSLTVDPANFPSVFGPAGSVLFRDASLPARPEVLTPNFPAAVISGQAVNDFASNLRQGYVQSWNLSFQRELSHSTVLDVRYVGNHSVGLWRQVDLNEVNIFENHFLDEFKVAQKNLALNQAQNPSSTDFSNRGLPGQGPVPILQTSTGLTSDTTIAQQLQRGQAGTLANSIANNATRMANLTKAGYPVNLFYVNPTVGNGRAFLMMNGGGSTYNALQLELRRRMAKGLLVQGSYAWSKSLTNMDASSSSVFSEPTTFRSPGNDKGPSPWDIRHGFKLNFVYELPFGNPHNAILHKVVEGWQIGGVSRIQSGSPDLLTSGGRGTFNQNDNGVVLHNLTIQQLENMVQIRKTTGANGVGQVFFLPQDIINNTLAAWEVGGFTLANLDPNKPYIGPQFTPGQLGNRIFLYGPWQQRWDLTLVKRTSLGEKRSLELRAQFLNAFNQTNFLLGAAGNDVNTLGTGGITGSFGQTTSAYRDFSVSGSNDPGGRMIEFALRFKF